MLVQAVYDVFLPHPSNCGVVHNPVKMCERRSANGPISEYGIDLYVAVVFTTVQPEVWQQCEQAVIKSGFVVCVIDRSIRRWMAAMLRCCKVTLLVSKGILNSSVPPMSALQVCVLLKENSYFLFSSLYKKPLFRVVIGVLPSPTLIRESFLCRWCVRAF